MSGDMSEEGFHEECRVTAEVAVESRFFHMDALDVHHEVVRLRVALGAL